MHGLIQVDDLDHPADDRSFILSPGHVDNTDLQHVDVDTRDRLQALLEAAGKLLLLQLSYGPLDFVRNYPGEWYQEDKTNLDLQEQEIVSCSGISWAICKSALHPRQIIMPTSNHSVFYRPDALPAAQPTALND